MASSKIFIDASATEADIQQVLDTAVNGDTVVFPENKTILIVNGLSLSTHGKSLTLDLNGSVLQQAGRATVLTINGFHDDGEAAKLGKNASGQVTVSYVDASTVSVGDYVKIYSDDALPNDQGAVTRMGQAMKVIAVSGDTLTLDGNLYYADVYKTNVRASAYDGSRTVIENGTVRGDQNHPSWTTNLIDVRSTVGTQIDHVTVRDGNSMGINFVDSVNGLVTQSAAINLTDDTSHGHYGYGVHSASSVGTTVDGFYAETVRHAVDDNAVGFEGTQVNPARYGADYAMRVSNVVVQGATAYAFSWHSEGRYNQVTDSAVFDSYGVLGARGTDNTFSNVSGAGNNRGITFYEYGDEDGRRIDVSNVNLKENSGYAFYNQNEATDNTLSNSTFEVLSDKVIIAPDDPSLTQTNVTLKVGAFAINETMTGTWGGDRMLGANGDDSIDGRGGNDYIWGGDGHDVLTGGAGSDRFAYHAVSEAGDTITDFSSGDVIDVAVMAKSLGWSSVDGHARFIQSGSDTLFQVDANGGGNSYVTMATLKDVAASSLASNQISTDIVVTAEGLRYTGQVNSTPQVSSALPSAFSDIAGMATQLGLDNYDDTLLGTSKADLLVSLSGSDYLRGMEGNDILAGGAGADRLFGGSGVDVASYADASAGVVVSLADRTINTGDGKGDSYNQIEGLAGSAFSDKLIGNSSVNTISGGSGDDYLYGLDGTDTLIGEDGNDTLSGGNQNDTMDGGSGNDTLIGGAGFDRLTGGSGSDTFVFDYPGNGSDSIVDFKHGIDTIALSSSFGIDSLDGIDFISSDKPSSATTANPTLLFNVSTGSLLWDPDGSGVAPAAKIVDLLNHERITLSDIIVL